MKTINQIIQTYNGQLYLNQKEVANLIGITRQKAAEFLISNSIPYYCLTGKSKTYFLPEILEVVEKTKHKDFYKIKIAKDYA
jgi:hypothetical protein